MNLRIRKNIYNNWWTVIYTYDGPVHSGNWQPNNICLHRCASCSVLWDYTGATYQIISY